MTDFVHLHVHSDYSILDGCAKFGRMFDHLKANGMKSIALTDHGNMFGVMGFYDQAKKAGIKPLLGSEVYLVIDHKNTERPQHGRVDAEGGECKNTGLAGKIFHMGLIAQNNEGYANLVKIVSDAHINGFYYRPRTDLEHLRAHSKGLYAFSGCLAGVIPQHLVRGDEEGARKWVETFIEIFDKDHFVIELQDHGIPEQKRINPMLLKLAADYGLMAICSNDSHYVEASDFVAHDILLCIQTGAKLSDTDRFRFDRNEFYIKSPQQMEALFGDHPELLSNTVKIADSCEVSFDNSNKYPAYTMTAEEAAKYADNKAMLRAICEKGLHDRYGVDYAAQSTDEKVRTLCERMDYELAMIERMGFIDYFLVVQDFIIWAKSVGIPVGPGRGSGAGSLVAYTTGITNIDPMRFKLFFERFLNPDRVSPPDFDIDFCMRRREEVVEYVRRRYGSDCVSNIITYGTFGAKMVIRDICRVKDIPFAEADRLAKMVPEGVNPKTQHGWKLTDAAELPELAEEIKKNPLAQEIYKQGSIIEGMVRSTGKHAAGVVITSKPLVEYLPMTMQEGALTTQYDKNQVEHMGLLKMDFLGLKTLTVIDDGVKNVREYKDANFDIDKIPLDDPAVFELIISGRTPGVFQLESPGMQNTCKQVGISTIEDMNAVIALYRPGPMGFIPDYAAGKKDPAAIHYPHPLLKEVLAETYGIIVYQEQVMEAAKILAGYTLGGADILRRAMGKKKIEEMEKQRAIFVEGAAKTNNIPKEKALEVFAILEKFASYGFNKAHSAAYAVISYQTAYLKAHYPVEFMAAVLSSELGNSDNVAKFIRECVEMNIPVLGPNVNRSGLMFTPSDGQILFGLAAIKGVGEGASQKIIAERKANGPYKDFKDFVSRQEKGAVNRRVMEALIKTGAFDSCGEQRAYLLENIEELTKSAAQADSNQVMLFDLFAEAAPAEVKKTEPLPFQTRLQYEKELLGFYLSGHPLDEFKGLVDAIDTTTDPRALEDKKYFRICGVVSEVTKRFSKKDNQPWAFFKVSTQTSTYEMSAFSRTYANYGSLLEEGAILLLIGQTRHQNDEVRFSIESVKPLAGCISNLIKKVTLTLDCHHPDALGWLKGFQKELIETVNGDMALQILCANGDKLGALAELPDSLKWRYSPAALKKLRETPCIKNISATAAGFTPPERQWNNAGGNGGYSGARGGSR